MDKKFISTSFDISGYKINQNLGVVRGSVVRSRSFFENLSAATLSLFGGNISIYTKMCERARDEAFEKMLVQAEELSANAIIGMTYYANEIAPGITEVLCYGTAVLIKKNSTIDL